MSDGDAGSGSVYLRASCPTLDWHEITPANAPDRPISS